MREEGVDGRIHRPGTESTIDQDRALPKLLRQTGFAYKTSEEIGRAAKKLHRHTDRPDDEPSSLEAPDGASPFHCRESVVQILFRRRSP